MFFQTDRSRRAAFVCAVALAALFAGGSARAQEVRIDEGETSSEPGMVFAPFGFFNSTIGAAFGTVLGSPGLLQDGSDLYLTLVGSQSGTAYGILSFRDFHLPWARRFFYDAGLSLERFSDLEVYIDGNPKHPDHRAGSNDSNKNDFLTGHGTEHQAWLQMNYLFPLGVGADEIEHKVTLRGGIPVEGARDTSVWNPLESGFTTAFVQPFYRSQNLKALKFGDQDLTTSGLQFGLRYDNTDFSPNPSHGSSQQISYTKDWGNFNSSAPWETVDFTASKYLSLGGTATARQRVIALNFWIIDTPSWKQFSIEDGAKDFHRPPPFTGATLGGQDRMKGFSEGRFNDRSAIYYTAEFRYIPDWNPAKDIPVFRHFDVKTDWFQFVAGVEVGRVAEKFDLQELHSNMQVSLDGGIRAMINQIIVRADVGVTDEGFQVQMTVDQPF